MNPPSTPSSSAAPWQSFEACTTALAPHPAGLVPDPSHRTASTWARAIVSYWQRCDALKPTQPLYLLDIQPGSSSLACLLLRALHQELAQAGLLHWPVRYLLCDLAPASTTARHACQHPELADFVHRGWLDHAQWSGHSGAPLMLGDQRSPLFGSRNPVVMVSWFGLSRLSAALVRCHLGQVHTAQVRPQPASAATPTPQLELQWNPDPTPPALDNTATALLEHYRCALTQATVLLPLGALRLANAVSDWSGRQCLSLCADIGIAHLADICEGAFEPPTPWPWSGTALPLNLHALAWHHRHTGAQVATLDAGFHGVALQMACQDPHQAFDPDAWQTMQDLIDQAHPADPWDLQPSSHPTDTSPTAHSGIAQLRLCPPGSETLALWLHQHHGTAPENDQATPAAASQRALRRSLRALWRHTPPSLRTPPLLRSLAQALMQHADWPLLREVLDSAATAFPPAEWSLHRAWLALATGDNDAALAHLQHHLHQQPEHAQAHHMHATLRLRQSQRLATRWHPANGVRGTELTLEMLDEWHLNSYVQQFRDPCMPWLTGLLPVHSLEEAHAQLQADRALDRHTYAVMHHRCGFVGVVGLCALDTLAHLDIWIGIDYQGQGLGTQALQTLLPFLASLGIGDAYTMVHRCNPRSRRLLSHLGFEPAVLPELADDPDHTFLHLPLRSGCTPAPPEQARRLWRHCNGLDALPATTTT